MLLTQLSSELSVSARTVWRDSGVLQTAGFSVDEQLGERGVKGWRIPSPRPQLQVGYADLISVMISRQFKSGPRHRTPAPNPFRPRGYFFSLSFEPRKTRRPIPLSRNNLRSASDWVLCLWSQAAPHTTGST